VHGQADMPPNATHVLVELRDSSLSVNGMAVAHFVALPYSSLVKDLPGLPVGSVTINQAQIEWLDKTDGLVQAVHDGKPKSFSISKRTYSGKNIVSVESNYRHWYGYPAQALLLVSVPVDIAIDVVVVCSVLVAMPIVYGVRLIKGETPTDARRTGTSPDTAAPIPKEQSDGP